MADHLRVHKPVNYLLFKYHCFNSKFLNIILDTCLLFHSQELLRFSYSFVILTNRKIRETVRCWIKFVTVNEQEILIALKLVRITLNNSLYVTWSFFKVKFHCSLVVVRDGAQIESRVKIYASQSNIFLRQQQHHVSRCNQNYVQCSFTESMFRFTIQERKYNLHHQHRVSKVQYPNFPVQRPVDFCLYVMFLAPSPAPQQKSFSFFF